MCLLARPGATKVLRVWLTVNVPEPDLLMFGQEAWPFELHVLSNDVPKGFGANHNQAFDREQQSSKPASFFCVLNPDMEWIDDPFPPLLSAVQSPKAGCVYPRQIDSDGNVQDHRRTLPTPRALVHRHLTTNSTNTINKTDWINAAFLVFPTNVFAELGGFDTGYFMYCEDVDISLRLQLAGYELIEVPTTKVIHHARRASRKNLQHMVWHLISLLRLWRSKSYRRYASLSEAKKNNKRQNMEKKN